MSFFRQTELVCLLSVVPMVLHAQNGGTMPMQGHIEAEQSSLVAGQINIQICDRTGREVAAGSPAIDGSFRFDMVSPGEYRIRITTSNGDTLRDEYFSWGPYSGPLQFDVKRMQAKARPGTGTVSVSALRHKVPGKAVSEFGKAQDANEHGDFEGSVRHLEKAVEIDPEYSEALTSLGARYLRAGKQERGVELMRRSITADPGNAAAYANLAVALLQTGQPQEAEVNARKSLSLDNSRPHARYMLGLALAQQRKLGPETTASLEASVEPFPDARLAFAQVLAMEGKSKEAESQLMQYLRLPNVSRRSLGEEFLRQLRAANQQHPAK